MGAKKTVITSAHHAHYIGYGVGGEACGAWLWVRNFHDAHRFDSRGEAESFTRREIPGMQDDVWYLGGLS